MLRRNLVGRAVRSAKHDRYFELSTRHVKHLRRVVDDLVRSEDRKVEGHEFDHRPKSRHGCTDSEPGKSKLSDRRVNDPLVTELFPEPASDLVGAVVLCY